MSGLRQILVAAFCALFTAAAIMAPAPAFAAEGTISVTDIVPTGTTHALAAADSQGSKFLVGSDERVFFHCLNTNGSVRNVTLVAQQTSARVAGVGTVTISNITVAVPATTGDVVFGPISQAYIDTSGYAHVTYDAVTGLTCAAFRLPSRAQ